MPPPSKQQVYSLYTHVNACSTYFYYYYYFAITTIRMDDFHFYQSNILTKYLYFNTISLLNWPHSVMTFGFFVSMSTVRISLYVPTLWI